VGAAGSGDGGGGGVAVVTVVVVVMVCRHGDASVLSYTNTHTCTHAHTHARMTGQQDARAAGPRLLRHTEAAWPGWECRGGRGGAGANPGGTCC